MHIKIILTTLLLMGSIGAQAQESSGTIDYESTMDLGNVRLSNLPEEVMALLPKEDKTQAVLRFTANNSLYEEKKQEQKKDKEFTSADQNSNVKISVSSTSDESKTYTDLQAGKIIEQRDFMGKKFLIEDNMERSKWRITGRQKILLDYPVQEAISIDRKDTVIAWFCPKIPVSTGPKGIAGLPGIVLEAAIGSKVTVKATKITMDANTAASIEIPKKGKKVTRAAFMKIVEEKSAELKQQFGNGNSRTEINIIR